MKTNSRGPYEAFHSLTHIPLLIALCCSLANGQNLVSRPVGFIRISVPPHSCVAASMPFLPFDANLDAVMAGQLTGTADPATADRILKWDPATAGYLTACKLDGAQLDSGEPDGMNGKWLLQFEDRIPADWTLYPGDGFFLNNRQDFAQTVFLRGEIVLEPTNELAFLPGPNLFGYPYSTAVPWGRTRLASLLRAEPGDAVLLPGVPAEDARLLDADLLPPGQGLWYRRAGTTALTWHEPRPYAAPFPTNDEPPFVWFIRPVPAENAAILGICGSGAAKLDVFVKDISPTNPANFSSGWTVAVSNLDTGGRNWLEWRDSCLPAQDAGVVGRAYLISRSDVDTDRDGVPDGREAFVNGTDPAVADGPVVDPGGATDGGEPGGPTVAGRTLYVDATTGRDDFSGLQCRLLNGDGPKRSIRAALAAARAGDSIIMAAGAYPEKLDVGGRDVKVYVSGPVHLSAAVSPRTE